MTIKPRREKSLIIQSQGCWVTRNTSCDDNPLRFAMIWRPDQQRFAVGEDAFENFGPTRTHPSHDLAHLLVAANGTLHWKPGVDRNANKIAEYNAVFLEHLMDRAYCSLFVGGPASSDILPYLLSYADWFVRQHYRPFPLSTSDALKQFCSGLNPEILSRLALYFLDLKRNEKSYLRRPYSEIRITFYLDDQPAPADDRSGAFQKLVKELLLDLKANNPLTH
jgi:hypothetical protein